MPKTLEGKVALITGGSRGIGAAIAKRLAPDGAKVTITYAKDANSAAAVVKALNRPVEGPRRSGLTLPIPRPSKTRSKRPSRLLASSTYL